MPQAKLADAQHALAKDYGFAIWAKLKSHVEALVLTPALAPAGAIVPPEAESLEPSDAVLEVLSR